ncbi:hypothetical protein PSTG_02896 [Puccinia striiformis f. sp. tritici PST-78]|uniref:Uncharacterized protein n=1 Tax=Puccinia striiformis f. sp. tritici PST-78 TaxID=1165861 RepID=A0A0L0VX82_9BASI|nr:hypothetical protein PSTG_02896 [Puccinia striiformis f. sp. tritici PST-78]
MAIVWVWATVRLPAAAQRLIRQAGLEDATRNLSTRRDPTGHRVGCPSEYPFLGPHAHECLGFQNSFQDPCCNTRNPVMPPKAFISFLIQYQAWWRRGHKSQPRDTPPAPRIGLGCFKEVENLKQEQSPSGQAPVAASLDSRISLAVVVFYGADGLHWRILARTRTPEVRQITLALPLAPRGWVDLLTGNCSLGFIVAGHQRV